MCNHCWHMFYGPYMAVLLSDQYVVECCQCGTTSVKTKGH
jgi:hypothetical protein